MFKSDSRPPNAIQKSCARSFWKCAERLTGRKCFGKDKERFSWEEENTTRVTSPVAKPRR